ncbi:hypothetical protein BU16DRAFT_391574 [Lophium mytilinum]|uniref:Uncharacterized protein n=1 Tax=Lophium mytilinum TaxID=390894 RepID=A0A6A6QWX0_9PEZI|nr:hypothetical protein BU16DRAFT_391574 [Lophium mytilinum]
MPSIPPRCREIAAKIYTWGFHTEPPPFELIPLYTHWSTEFKRRRSRLLIAATAAAASVPLLHIHQGNSRKGYEDAYDEGFRTIYCVFALVVRHALRIREGELCKRLFYEYLAQAFLLGVTTMMAIHVILSADWLGIVEDCAVVAYLLLVVVLVAQAFLSLLRPGGIRHALLLRPDLMLNAHYFYGLYFIFYAMDVSWSSLFLGLGFHHVTLAALLAYQTWWKMHFLRRDWNQASMETNVELGEQEEKDPPNDWDARVSKWSIDWAFVREGALKSD